MSTDKNRNELQPTALGGLFRLTAIAAGVTVDAMLLYYALPYRLLATIPPALMWKAASLDCETVSAAYERAEKGSPQAARLSAEMRRVEAIDDFMGKLTILPVTRILSVGAEPLGDAISRGVSRAFKGNRAERPVVQQGVSTHWERGL